MSQKNQYKNKHKDVVYNGNTISGYEYKSIQGMKIEDIIRNSKFKFYSIDHLIYYYDKVMKVELSTATISRRLNMIKNLTKVNVANRVSYFDIDDSGLYDTKKYKVGRTNDYISKERLLSDYPNFELLRRKRFDNNDMVSFALNMIERDIISAHQNGQDYLNSQHIFRDENILNLNHEHDEYKPIYEAITVVKFLKRQHFDVEFVKNGRDSYLKITW